MPCEPEFRPVELVVGMLFGFALGLGLFLICAFVLDLVINMRGGY